MGKVDGGKKWMTMERMQENGESGKLGKMGRKEENIMIDYQLF